MEQPEFCYDEFGFRVDSLSTAPQERGKEAGAVLRGGVSMGRAGFGGSANRPVSDKLNLRRTQAFKRQCQVQSLPVWSPRGHRPR